MFFVFFFQEDVIAVIPPQEVITVDSDSESESGSDSTDSSDEVRTDISMCFHIWLVD